LLCKIFHKFQKVKNFQDTAANFYGLAPCQTPNGASKDSINGNKFQTKRPALSETGELGNGRKSRRSATGQKVFNRLAEDGKFRARSDFNPRRRNRNDNGGRCRFNFAMRDGDDSAIVIVLGNRPAVQPRVEWRPRFGHGHEQPDGQRQNARRQKKTLAVSAADWKPSVLQSVCNIANATTPASGFLRVN
jgi:hypothetical protein